ncbi:hypothetical protein F2Q69_00047649 [Brassica cretica]|uniref:Uncharacterized protein n=1 Tax=Brassica cretica TaxID=69181 RepID=A0A8S9Q2P6_BRACR|nr:hypothetical protein F2Q69_00047649 [Brassica cretica]
MISWSKRTSWIDRGIQLGRSRAGPVQFGEQPSWINHEIQLGRSPSWIDHGIQLGRSPSWTSLVRQTAELDRPSNPSSPRPGSSSPEIVSNSLLFRLDRRCRWNFTI